MIEDIKLVICDIDWTLLSKNKRVLSDYTKNILETLHKKGIYFGLASGRPLDEVLKVYQSWKLNFPCDVIISMNGGKLWDEHTHKVYEFYKLKKEWIKEIVQMTAPMNVNPYMYYHNALKAMKKDKEIEATATRNQKKLIIARDIDDFADEDNGKVMIRVKEENMEQFENYIKQYISPYYQSFKTQRTLIEFTDCRVSKGNALKEYCQMTDLPLEKILAFGDTTNDNEMLKIAGWGVCMNTGSEDTKAISNDVTELTADEDGVAHYIEKYFFH